MGVREEGGGPVRTVDVKPEVVLAREAAEPFEVVDDTRVGGAGGGDDADDVVTVGIGFKGRLERGASEAVVRRWRRRGAERLGRAAPCRCSNARRQRSRNRTSRGLSCGRLARPTSRPHRETREVPDRAARNESAAQNRSACREVRQVRQRWFSADDDTARLEPTGAVQP